MGDLKSRAAGSVKVAECPGKPAQIRRHAAGLPSLRRDNRVGIIIVPAVHSFGTAYRLGRVVAKELRLAR